MVEHLFLQVKSGKKYDGQLRKTNYELMNVISFPLNLTSNLVFFHAFVKSAIFFRVKFQLAPKCLNQNMKEHNEK